MMGSPPDEEGRYDDEGPQHQVRISKPFAIGRFPVTFAEWDYAQDHPDWQSITGLAPRKPTDRGWGREDRPVIHVSWDDAQAYMAWLSKLTDKDYRLPSEADWEYVCRAGTQTPFWWGSSIFTDQANYDGSDPYAGRKGEYREQTLPVKSFDPNPWGLYQVHGNVWEWCADDMRAFTAESLADPVGSLESPRRALRGGSWLFGARLVRAADRDAIARDYRSDLVGFRCARVL